MNATKTLTHSDAFPLLDDVIVLTDAAMHARTPAKIVPALVDGLRGLLGGDIGELPAELLRTDGAGYARRELYCSPRFGYRVFALTWAPGQSSPIHDHADTWGVEAVLRGQLEVVDYRSVRQYDAITELQPFDRHDLTAGRVIGLLPPHDLHACRNAAGDEVTVSLHVYGRNLERVRSFVHAGGNRYRQEEVRLATV